MADSMTLTLLGISILLNAVCIYLMTRKDDEPFGALPDSEHYQWAEFRTCYPLDEAIIVTKRADGNAQ